MDLGRMIDQFAEMYPYDRERMLNKKTEEIEAVERAKREAELAPLPPPHELAAPLSQAPQPQEPQPPQPQEPQPPQPQEPPQPPQPQPSPPAPQTETFRPTMLQMLDKDRLKRETVVLQHEQRAFRMRIFRGVLIAIAVGSLVLYFSKRR